MGPLLSLITHHDAGTQLHLQPISGFIGSAVSNMMKSPRSDVITLGTMLWFVGNSMVHLASNHSFAQKTRASP